jgi:ribosomal protein L37AE/L43A
MAKVNSCPQCGSKKIKLHVPQTSIWKCEKCGYQGSVVIEDGNLEKQIKETKKMEKLSKKLAWKR